MAVDIASIIEAEKISLRGFEASVVLHRTDNVDIQRVTIAPLNEKAKTEMDSMLINLNGIRIEGDLKTSESFKRGEDGSAHIDVVNRRVEHNQPLDAFNQLRARVRTHFRTCRMVEDMGPAR